MSALTRSLLLHGVGVVAVLALAGCGGADGVSDGTAHDPSGQSITTVFTITVTCA